LFSLLTALSALAWIGHELLKAAKGGELHTEPTEGCILWGIK